MRTASERADHRRTTAAPDIESFYDSAVAELESWRMNDSEDEWAQGFNDAITNALKMLGKKIVAARKGGAA